MLMLVINMSVIKAVIFSVLLSASWCLEDLAFPPGFKFGAASSSYQVEGAWNVSDKSESIWDRFTHTFPERIADHGNGNIACDSYHLWRRDIEMAVELGLHFYRFSISWPRLLPTGFPNYISDDGEKYYSNLINGLLEKGIEPVVTIYHWELPQRLQDLGGWTNPLISDWFAEYARIVFTLYGDRVKTWITINEPLICCEIAYNMGIMAPGVIDPEIGPYLCNKHMLLAHAKAWRIYDKEFRHKYHGELSLANQLFWYEAMTEADKELAELVQENSAGRYSHPIYSKEGGWPHTIEKALSLNSRKQGYPKSNFPTLTKHEIEFIKGTYDFYAINHYSSRLVRKARRDEKLGPWPVLDVPDLDAKLEVHPHWPKGGTSWFSMNPEGLRKQLLWLKRRYGNIKILITENGYPDTRNDLNDMSRVKYYQENLKQVLLAIKEDGLNITGYTAWTLMDNFEWMDGYTAKFGLYKVDFNSPQRTRTPRASAFYYKNIIKAHSLHVPHPRMLDKSSGTHRVVPSVTMVCLLMLTLFILKILNQIKN